MKKMNMMKKLTKEQVLDIPVLKPWGDIIKTSIVEELARLNIGECVIVQKNKFSPLSDYANLYYKVRNTNKKYSFRETADRKAYLFVVTKRDYKLAPQNKNYGKN